MTEPAVGIVVVSHSRALAQAAVALAEQMVHDRTVRIEQAAGLEDGTFGTDAVRVADAISRADGGRGVVVLMDLGSAVLSAELALDLLDPPLRERVLLCPAPLVEGLSVAAVTAGAGAGRDEVAAEALGALAGKQAHLTSPPPPADHAYQSDHADRADHVIAPGSVPVGAPDVVTGSFEVTWPHGLHARPAAVLVQAARALDADVRLRNATLGTPPVPAGSLSQVATLGAVQGHVVEVTASGPAARPALDRILQLAATGFGDRRPPSLRDQGISGDQGIQAGRTGPLPAAPGIAVAPAWVLGASAPSLGEVGHEPTGDPHAEWSSLRAALAEAEKDIRDTREHTALVAGEAHAAIFDAHLLLLEDPALIEPAHAAIEAGDGAAAAWASAVAEVETALAGLPDDYLRARAADVRTVGQAVLQRLAGGSAPSATLDDACGVLVAQDLTPAQAATLDPDRVAGVVLAGGSPTAHSAILTRALGIPTVVAAGPALLAVAPGTVLAVDGTSGELVIDPPPDVRAAFTDRATALARRRDQARALGGAPAVTLDGVHVHVGANVSSIEDARAAAAAGADLAGLVRTEFLFLGRSRPPDVEEQAAVYRALAEAMAGRRIVVRTLDVGGDKPLDYLPQPAEANPFLGVRGIRLALARPRLLADQLLAVVQVAHDHPVDVMFPMVSTVPELMAARGALVDAVRADGRPAPAGLRVGIMVEVPASALKARAFAPHVDFLSIGTNDLTQYAMAAERGNQTVAGLADPVDPGVLGLVAAAAGAGVPVAVCGELAADESVAGLLLGLGVRELSVVPSAVAQVKQAVREVDLGRAAGLAREALAAPDAGVVRALLTREGPAG